jgi:predicted ferric reductase
MSIIKKYRSEVIRFENPLHGIYEVELKSLERQFSYKPGQFLHLALDPYDPSSPWPESRCFSMRSAPSEKNLSFTFSVKGKFTRRMSEELTIGKEVVVKMPYGSLFSANVEIAKHVFIAGGTGVVPFLSLFNSEIFKNYSNPCLYLGLKDSRHNIYFHELSNAADINPVFKICIFHEDREGLIDIDSVFRENGFDAIYYMAGPPAMIKLFSQNLLEKGVKISRIITDDWE